MLYIQSCEEFTKPVFAIYPNGDEVEFHPEVANRQFIIVDEPTLPSWAFDEITKDSCIIGYSLEDCYGAFNAPYIP